MVLDIHHGAFAVGLEGFPQSTVDFGDIFKPAIFAGTANNTTQKRGKNVETSKEIILFI